MKKLVSILLIVIMLLLAFSSCNNKNNSTTKNTNNSITESSKIAASSNNFEITNAMMEYFANSYYQNWYSQNYYYILLGYINFAPHLPLDEQYTDTAKTQTYYDYFVAGTKATVETYLKYCEAAKTDSSVDYSKLESDAKEYATDSINQLKEAAKAYSDTYYENYGSRITLSQYIKQNYGQRVTQKDLEHAFFIEHIASSYYNIVYDRINGTVDKAREDKYFKENLYSFITADYLVYTLSSTKTVNFPNSEDYIGGIYSSAYNKAIEGKTPEQVMNMNIYPEDYEGGIYSVAYQRDLETAINNKKTNEENRARDMAIMQRLASAKTEEEFKNIIRETSSTNLSDRTAYYTLTSKLGQTLFGGVKAQYGIGYDKNELPGASAATNTAWIWDMLEVNIEDLELSIKITKDAITELNDEIAAETDVEAKATLESNKKTLETSLETYKKNLETAKEKFANSGTTSEYSYSVYFVTKSAHRDETILRNVGHILFKVDSTKDTDPAVSYKTSAEAKAAAQVLLGQMVQYSHNRIISAELFEEFASSTHDSSVFYYDISKGEMVEEFENWLFSATTVGELGLVETAYGWHIMYYGGETGDIAWRVIANKSATAEDISSWYEALPSYGIEFNDAIFKTIFDIK